MNRRVTRVLVLGLAVATFLSFVVTACGDDDKGGVETIGDSSSASVSGEPAGPGVVEPKPANVTNQVNVTLKEWAIATDRQTVPAGDIYFLVDNQGPDDPHEFVIIKSNLAVDKLPTSNGKVPEDKVDLIDEIEPFTPNSKAGETFNLKPGKYVLICNIAEVEDGKLESHYQLGMRTTLT
ncbi:MAG: hypothetical protein AB7P33_09095, partial [Dehalococcoidia bacterium]